jgi:hypothetical protein
MMYLPIYDIYLQNDTDLSIFFIDFYRILR